MLVIKYCMCIVCVFNILLNMYYIKILLPNNRLLVYVDQI